MKSSKFLFLLIVAGLFAACRAQSGEQENDQNYSVPDQPDVAVQTKAFKDYWYAGKGEISHYNLQQIRYGQVHEGSAVMVFVTENFLIDKQVKLESKANGRPNTTVMKLNFLRSFDTGIYRYHTMTSTFTPVKINKYHRSLKVASYSQEWCGIWYAQLNLQQDSYKVTGHSYFEDEADYQKRLSRVWLEDEIWTKLRLNPALLPEGRFDIIPGSFAVRRSHSGWQVEKAVAAKQTWSGTGMPGQNLMAYRITYPQRDRKLTIVYENKAPFRIAGWVEKQKTREGKTLTARSVRTKTIKRAYWNLHDKSDRHLRDSLGLSN